MRRPPASPTAVRPPARPAAAPPGGPLPAAAAALRTSVTPRFNHHTRFNRRARRARRTRRTRRTRHTRAALLRTVRELIQFAYPRWRLVRAHIEATAQEIESAGERMALLTRGAREAAVAQETHAAHVVAAWQELYGELLVRYSDGWDYDSTKLAAARVGYPAWWLTEVGYVNGTESCKTTCP